MNYSRKNLKSAMQIDSTVQHCFNLFNAVNYNVFGGEILSFDGFIEQQIDIAEQNQTAPTMETVITALSNNISYECGSKALNGIATLINKVPVQ